MATCDTKTGVCESSANVPAQEQKKCCYCKGACGGDPITCSMNMWSHSFFKAMQEVQIEMLKAKIQKGWGPMLEKEANAVIEAMDSKWKSMIAVEKAKGDLRAKFQELCREK